MASPSLIEACASVLVLALIVPALAAFSVSLRSLTASSMVRRAVFDRHSLVCGPDREPFDITPLRVPTLPWELLPPFGSSFAAKTGCPGGAAGYVETR